MQSGLPSESRRGFLKTSMILAAGAGMSLAEPGEAEPIIDIHQHTDYTGRTNRQLIAHQKALGVTTTVLLPAGSMYGLDCGCGRNESVVALAREHPDQFVFFANEVAGLADARAEITRYLKRGAVGIGEQKFRVPCDSAAVEEIAEIAKEFGVPVLLHFQHGAYNVGLKNFGKILRKYPEVNFIGHAQTWWGHTDKNHDEAVLYPKGEVVAGGVTDRLLTEHGNMYGDLSAGSGLNFLTRDPGHARAFLARHQDKLLFGTDCNDPFGEGPGCQGAQTLAAVRRLSEGQTMERKILYGNAKRLLGL